MFDKPLLTSLELVAKINEFRKEEGRAELAHNNFLKSIRKEFAEVNIYHGSYLDENNQERPLINLTRRQAMIMGMKESGTIRHRVMDYIESLEQKVGMTDDEIVKASFDILNRKLAKSEQVSLEKSTEMFTPTQLGKLVKKKPQEINDALTAAGFQSWFPIGTGRSYRLTPTGHEFGVYGTSPAARKQQLHWRKAVLDKLTF